MSIIQQHTSATLGDSWRTINIDAYNEDSSVNFDISTLHPPQPEISEAQVRQLAGQVRQLLQGGDAEGALRGCLDTPVYNGTDEAKVRFFSLLLLAHRWHGKEKSLIPSPPSQFLLKRLSKGELVANLTP